MQTSQHIAPEFDFDEWARLARENPAEFERRRRAAIEALIASAPQHARRLQGTQWRIDRERELAHTPLKACLRISAMMWESFLEMKSALDKGAASVARVARSDKLELVNANGQAFESAQGPSETAERAVPVSNVLTFARCDADEPGSTTGDRR